MEELNYRELGQRIRQQRMLLRMTQEQLAERAGISLSFLGHIERGSRKASLDTFVKVCNALLISPGTLLQDSLDDRLLGIDDQIPESRRRLLREISDVLQGYDSTIE